MTLFDENRPIAPADSFDRFGSRWRLIGAGLSNVWRYGDLDLVAPSGRLLLRGSNGTGKTTALEAIFPFLIDLNARRMVAGKGRTTSLGQLMRDGAGENKRRLGYAWMSLEGPDRIGVRSYGVRLNWSKSGSPQVRTTCFTVLGRPLHELPLWGANGAALSDDSFVEVVEAAGGTVFDNKDGYLRDLASLIFSSERIEDLADLADTVRQVRNPSLLADTTPDGAAELLRSALPSVDTEVVSAVAEALAESDTTRAAFEGDRHAAEILRSFADAWAGHALDVTRSELVLAKDAEKEVQKLRRKLRAAAAAAEDALTEFESAQSTEQKHRRSLEIIRAQIEGAENTDDYREAGRLADLAATMEAKLVLAATELGALRAALESERKATNELESRANEIAADIAASASSAQDSDPDASAPRIVASNRRARPGIRVANDQLPRCEELVLVADIEALDDLLQSWDRSRTAYQARADLAGAHLTARGPVESLLAAAAARSSDAAHKAEFAQGLTAKETELAEIAQGVADDLVVRLIAWRRTAPDEPVGWDTEELSDLSDAEPFCCSWSCRTSAKCSHAGARRGRRRRGRRAPALTARLQQLTDPKQRC